MVDTTTTTTTPKSSSGSSNNNTNKTAQQIESAQAIRQKYEESKSELQSLLSRKKQVDQNLVNLEHSIYLFEGSYLEDTQQNGNIIRGFDGYLSSRLDRKKPKFTELDRLFSLSSSTYQKALAQKEERDQESSQDDHIGSPSSMRREKKRRLKLFSSGDLIRKKKRMYAPTEEYILSEEDE
ncbi:histone acetyltransferase subunit NuA4-domain-containing protein [Pilaira anomala]|nr:histone acetyltransferase subunit NuA4-domain-containing protein [Pilaira anomala]